MFLAKNWFVFMKKNNTFVFILHSLQKDFN